MKLTTRYGTLYFINKTNTKKSWIIASWHWAWSITWRWVFYFHPHRQGTKLGVHTNRRHDGRLISKGVNTPWGSVWLAFQDNMRR